MPFEKIGRSVLVTHGQHAFEFGVQLFQASSAKAWKESAQRAESLGYTAFHLADHYFGPGQVEQETRHPVQDLAAIPAMCFVAEATERIRVGCRVLCVDYHVPAVLAKELATIDFLSEGRLEIGLGAGWVQAEYRAMGVPWHPAGTRLERLEEMVDLLDAHFSGGQIALSGRHIRVEGYQGRPEPVQRPRPPIMIGGGAERVLRLAGRRADIVSFNFNNRDGRIGLVGLSSSTADETDRKVDWVRAGAGERFAALRLEISAYFANVTKDRRGALEGLSRLLGLPPEVLAEHPHVLVGSLEAIVEQLQARRERYGISYLTIPGRVMEEFAPVVERLAGQ
jgi:probable F420-dependent oxidoreductase